MTTTEQPATGAASRSATVVTAASGSPPSEYGLRQEALLALELIGLTAFAFSRPVLDSFGQSPETFVARGASGRDVVTFALLVAFGPVVVPIAIGSGVPGGGASTSGWWPRSGGSPYGASGRT